VTEGAEVEILTQPGVFNLAESPFSSRRKGGGATTGLSLKIHLEGGE